MHHGKEVKDLLGSCGIQHHMNSCLRVEAEALALAASDVLQQVYCSLRARSRQKYSWSMPALQVDNPILPPATRPGTSLLHLTRSPVLCSEELEKVSCEQVPEHLPVPLDRHHTSWSPVFLVQRSM